MPLLLLVSRVSTFDFLSTYSCLFHFMDDHELSSLPKAMLWGDIYLSQIHGFWCFPQHVPNVVRVVNEFKPLPNDVILASFPKTGTTWLKSLLFSILYRNSNYSKEHSLVNYNPHDLVPFLEIQVFRTSTPESSSILNNIPINPRLLGTHIPHQLLSKILDFSSSVNCPRVVYITRNPKDMILSMWHFLNKAKFDKITDGRWRLEEAVECFCSGILPFGPYYDHVMGFKKASLEKSENIFFITYEELMADTKSHVKRLAEFLGCPFESKDDKLVEEIVKSCSFDTLSSHDINKSGDIHTWCGVPYTSFFRHGVVGDHKNYLDAKAVERIDALTREKFHATGFIYGI